MTKRDCQLVLGYTVYSLQHDGPVRRIRRATCGNERTYMAVDWMALKGGEQLEMPPCTCPPMLEPWEMI